MENKFTPKPWFAVSYAGFINLQSIDRYGEPDILNEGDCEYAIANGKLAAIAPELLEFVIEITKKYPNNIWICNEANRLINKAIG
jgi:hypothetical protein